MVTAKEMLIGTYASWAPMPTEQQIAKCTHLSLAFIVPDGAEGKIKHEYYSRNIDSVVAMCHRHGVKVSLAFAGGGVAIDSTLMGVPAHRATLITNLLDFMTEYNLDGLDNDWEPVFMSPEEKMWKTNNDITRYYNVFTKEFRDSLDARFGVGEKIFSAAVMPLNWTPYQDTLLAKKSAHFPYGFWDYLDYVIIMAYDNETGAGHSTFDFVFDQGDRNTLHHWYQFGIPLEKMVLGLPLYGRGAWGGAHAGVDYDKIIAAFPDIDSLTDAVTMDVGGGELVYGFNGQATVLRKQAEAKYMGLMGVLLCFMHADMPLDHPRSLLAVLQPDEVSIIGEQYVVQGGAQLSYSCVENRLAFSKAFKAPHQLTIYGLNGQVIRTAAITPQKSSVTLPAEMAPGLYIMHLSGAEYSGAWKHQIQ